MPFFPFNPSARFGRDLPAISNIAQQLKQLVDRQVERLSEMTDQQFLDEYAPSNGLTRTQALSTLNSAKTHIDDASITALRTRIG